MAKVVAVRVVLVIGAMVVVAAPGDRWWMSVVVGGGCRWSQTIL